MNEYNQKNNPEFEKKMDFYVPVGAILIELKDNSAAIGTKNPNYTVIQFTSSLLGTED